MATYVFHSNPINYENELIHPGFEIKRCRLLRRLFDDFTRHCIGTAKPLSHRDQNKFDEIIAKFCWKNIGPIDPVIPYNSSGVYDSSQLEIDLNNKGIKKSNELIESFDFPNVLKKVMEETKKLLNHYASDSNVSVEYINERLVYNKDFVLPLSKAVIDNLDKYYNPIGSVDRLSLYFCVLCRYGLMDGKNQQLSVHPLFKNQIKKIYGTDFELFGSCINRSSKYYCSLYYDLEKHFGSQGNFFDIELSQGNYLVNPPFDEDLMEQTMVKIIESLESEMPLSFIITIPVWDPKTSKELSIKYKTPFFDMGPYKAIEIIDNHPQFIMAKHVLPKSNFPYYNMYTGKAVPAANTYVILLKNKASKVTSIGIDNIIRSMAKIHFP